MKQDKAEKIIQKAERRAAKAAKQVEAAGKKAEAARQRHEAQVQKRAAKAADAAAKKAAAKTKKAEAVAKKAQAAAKKAEEKKAKALAKTAARAVGAEGGEAQAGKKKLGKKKLLLIAIPVLAVAVGAGAFFFLKGGGEEEEAPQEPIAAPAEYVLNESHITALPVWGDAVLVYQDEISPEPPAEPEDAGDGGEEAEPAAGAEEGTTKIRYRYEGLQNPVSLISAYTALMTAEDAGFSLVDETLLRIDPPEELPAQGSLQLARNVPKAEDGTGGGVHALLLDWAGSGCSVTLDTPDGRVHDPKPEAAASAGPRWSLSDLESVHPSKLGLPGESMGDYTLIPQEGSVRIAGTGSVAMRVNIYGKDSQIAGIYFLANDGKLYKLDEATNAVSELKWEE